MRSPVHAPAATASMARAMFSVVVTWFGASRLQHGIEPGQRHIEPAVPRGLGDGAVQRLDIAGAEHVRPEGHRQKGVLGAALDPRPHQTAALRAVRAFARDIDEGERRVRRQGARRRQCVVVRDPAILVLALSRRRDAEAEEARIDRREFSAESREIREVPMDDRAKLGMGKIERRPHHRDDLRDAIVKQALAQHALADHAGGAEQQDIHGRFACVGSARPFAAGFRTDGMPTDTSSSASVARSTGTIRSPRGQRRCPVPTGGRRTSCTVGGDGDTPHDARRRIEV